MSTDITAETVVAPPQSYEQKLEECRRAGHYLADMECWNCGGEGFSHHDCGEDCCCCLHPEDNVVCDICEGDGGFKVCLTCHPESADEY